MKKLLFLILLLPSLCWGQELARMNMGVLGAVAASCVTAADTCNSATSGEMVELGRYDTEQTIAASIISDGAATLCNVKLHIWKVGSPTATHKVEFWTDDGGTPPANRPLALISSQSYAFEPEDITATDEASSITSPLSVNINWPIGSAGTKYWILVYRTTSGDSAANYLLWQRKDNCTPDNPVVKANHTQTTWVSSSDYRNMHYEFFK